MINCLYSGHHSLNRQALLNLAVDDFYLSKAILQYINMNSDLLYLIVIMIIIDC